MNVIKEIGRAALVLVLAVAAGRAEAGLMLVDQQYGTATGNEADSVFLNPSIGQSFTPTLTGIDFATFRVTDFGGEPGSYDVEVHAGINGALLGTSAPTALPAGFGGSPSFTGASVEFDFASTVALTPGSLYSLIVVRTDSSSNFALLGNFFGEGTYAGGDAITKGTIQSGDDYFFSEGISSAAADVPEIVAGSAISALTLLGCGVAMLRGRRKRASV
jgi:hypothetical protein